jgi:hypothetical protein
MTHEQRTLVCLSRFLVDQADLFRQDRMLYLILAAACLMVALRLMKRAFEPIGALVQGIVAAMLAVLVVSVALLLLAVAALAGH